MTKFGVHVFQSPPSQEASGCIQVFVSYHDIYWLTTWITTQNLITSKYLFVLAIHLSKMFLTCIPTYTYVTLNEWQPNNFRSLSMTILCLRVMLNVTYCHFIWDVLDALMTRSENNRAMFHVNRHRSQKVCITKQLLWMASITFANDAINLFGAYRYKSKVNSLTPGIFV